MNINNEEVLIDLDRTISDCDEDEGVYSPLAFDIQPNKKKNSKGVIKASSSLKNNRGRWTKGEQKEFIKCLFKHKTDWNRYCSHIKTRELNQIKIHAKNFILFHKKQMGASCESTPSPKATQLIRNFCVKYEYHPTDSELKELYHIIFACDEESKPRMKDSKPIFLITKESKKKQATGNLFLQKKTNSDISNPFIMEDYYNMSNYDFYSPFDDINDPRYEYFEQSTI